MPLRDAEKIAAKIAEEMLLELVDVELVKESTGRFLRFYIDKAPEGVNLDEVEAFHRRVQPMVENVDYDYMEVSSPGADRPLKKQRDFDRCAGMAVEVKTYKPIGGAKQFIGTLDGLKDGVITITMADDAKLSFNQKDVALTKLYIDFDEEDLEDEV